MKQYIVDAFTRSVFRGNPAAVCVMPAWLPDDLMQKIAIENNLSETAFVVKEGGSYRIRWFTPGKEVDLCGHATLASAYVLSRFYEPEAESFAFESLSGRLGVNKKGDLLEMDFPARMPEEIPLSNQMTAFQASPRGGIVYCELQGDRVLISGNAALYSEAEIYV